jgi:2-polyprenyl-6-hydroxyphenyl methylase/3-demethylubiquinone-9 3-methyltransferase
MYRYYSDKLSAERLRQVYEVAPPRVRQYLDAEVSHVLDKITGGDTVLELGCGYGRILPRLADKAGLVVGIDSSLASLILGRRDLTVGSNIRLVCMDASSLALAHATFDCVVCIQNGISAFHVDQRELVKESIRVTRPGGTVLFSTYADAFWDDRLNWFELQSRSGLLGEIDYDETGDGVIVCRDGFRATTVRPKEFEILVGGLDVDLQAVEVDQSSVFYEMAIP